MCYYFSIKILEVVLKMKKFVKVTAIVVVCLMAVAMFAACAPSSVEKAKEKLEDKDYVCLGYQDKESEGLQGGIIATKKDLSGDTVTAVWFDTVANAKEFYEDISGDEEENLKRSGKCVYWGTDQGIKDFTSL